MPFFNHRHKNNSSFKDLQFVNYKITFEPLIGTTPKELQVKMEKLLKKARRGSIGVIGQLQKNIKKYPEEAALKNYLYIAYKQKGKQKEAEQILQETIKEHPDYLFGKITQAIEYIEKGAVEKVPELLGEALEIGTLYPERDTFHVTEVQSFNHTIARYYLAQGKSELAEDRLKIMRKIDEEDYRVEDLERRLMAHRLEQMLERTKKSQELLIEVESFPTFVYEATDISPNLENEVLTNFYENIPNTLFEDEIIAIKQLDRNSLISDMELIIEDSIKRFEWYRNTFEEFDEYQQSFQVHALYWLAALKAKDSLPIVLNMLRQGETFLDYWYSDQLTDLLHEPLYLLAEDQLSVLKEFVIEPNLFHSARLCASQVVEQVAHHQRERQEEVEQWFEEVLQYHLDHSDHEGIIDTFFITWTVSYLMNINAVRLIPLVEKLWNKGWIDEMAIGNLNEIKSEMHRPHNPGDKNPIPRNIEEFYSGAYNERKEERIYSEEEKAEIERMKEEISDGYIPEMLKNLLADKESQSSTESMGAFDDYKKPNEITYYSNPIRNNSKIGRNEPCPCGSGKKYKKCCLNKN